MRSHSQETIAQSNIIGEVQNPVWRDVVKLAAVVMKDSPNEMMKGERERETAAKKGGVDDPVPALRLWDIFHRLRVEPQEDPSVRTKKNRSSRHPPPWHLSGPHGRHPRHSHSPSLLPTDLDLSSTAGGDGGIAGELGEESTHLTISCSSVYKGVCEMRNGGASPGDYAGD